MAGDWEATVRELAACAGIELRYKDALGHAAETPLESVAAVLSALGLPVGSEAEASRTLAETLGSEVRLAPPIVVAAEGDSPVIPLHDAAGADVTWSVSEELGDTVEGHTQIGRDDMLRLPPFPPGYHGVSLKTGGRVAETTVIVAPTRCWRPAEDLPRWGLSGPVYGLRSEQSKGIGDFSDVAAIAEESGRRGASFFGLSPIHSLFAADRTAFSPYSPSTRLFIDPIYIDPHRIDGDGADIDAADGAELVDYAKVWAAKRPVLGSLWSDFKKGDGSTAFEAFRRERGAALERHAIFEAFAEAEVRAGRIPYRDVPPVDSDAIATFAANNADAIGFHCWLQWHADLQLAAADAAARSSGMDIGLLADLAVGASPDGSDIWAAPDRFLTSLSIGAPPDALAPQGQNWSLRALSPLAMERNALAGFRELVRSNMRHCGGIRVDHAFQLRRLFLIPDGRGAEDGAYLQYPMEAMLAVLRLESHRAKCMVIGEDLGTKPPNFTETLRLSGILSYRVLYFERSGDDDFLPPARYAEDAMAVINTHDLATLEGWWRGRDIADRLRYGITSTEEAEAAYRNREVDRHRLMARLRAEGLSAERGLPDQAPVDAVFRLLARCRSTLVGVQLDDLVGETVQQNVPGVIKDAPNWRRRLPMTIAELSAPGGPLDRFAQAMAAEGRRRPSNQSN